MKNLQTIANKVGLEKIEHKNENIPMIYITVEDKEYDGLSVLYPSEYGYIENKDVLERLKNA